MTARKAGVIGWPISHSRSPIIHGYWLKTYGIEGQYDRYPVEPSDVGRFLRELPAMGLVGCNVTIPHKEAAFATVTVADDRTRRLAAVNTVFLRDGRPYGTNTDGEGFLANLAAQAGAWSPKGCRGVMLGAGGASRAIAGALIESGMTELVVVNRNRDRISALQKTFGRAVVAAGWTQAAAVLADADILVNTTSLGMSGHPPLELSLDRLPLQALVADIVYVPLETPLLLEAKARGHTIVRGLGMLLHQAVRGFELWFGKRPTVTPELYALVASDIPRTA